MAKVVLHSLALSVCIMSEIRLQFGAERSPAFSFFFSSVFQRLCLDFCSHGNSLVSLRLQMMVSCRHVTLIRHFNRNRTGAKGMKSHINKKQNQIKLKQRLGHAFSYFIHFIFCSFYLFVSLFLFSLLL